MGNQKNKFYWLINVKMILRGYDQTDTHILLLEVLIWLTFLGKNISMYQKTLKDFISFDSTFVKWEAYSKIFMTFLSISAI